MAVIDDNDDDGANDNYDIDMMCSSLDDSENDYDVDEYVDDGDDNNHNDFNSKYSQSWVYF